MARKPKFNSAQKLSILKEAKEKGIYEISKKYSINNRTIQQWCLLYKYQGIEGLKSKRTNQSYTLNFKISLVTAFMESGDSLLNFAIKNGLKSHTQLYNWIKRYNEGTLKAYQPRKRDLNLTKKRNSTRKTTFEERLEIIEFLIKHDINYYRTAEKYDVSYAQVYNWYKKYTKSNNDPESLRDNRGKRKSIATMNDLERLQVENRLLKAQLEQQKMEIAFAKKLVEIRNRGVKKN